MTRRFGAGAVFVLWIGMGAVFAQQPSAPRGGPGAPPTNDPRIGMMQGQGPAMDMTNPALRQPAMRGEIRSMPSAADLIRSGELASDVDARNCKACHDRPAIPIGGHDAPGTGFDGPSLSRRSWAAWWEVNREPYLRSARNQRETPIQSLKPTSQITSSLLDAARSGSADLRGEAILALGRMKTHTAVERMKELTKDPDPSCALRAWAAIGLLESQESLNFLATPPEVGADRIGWTLAVGLLSDPTEAMSKTLRDQVKDNSLPPEAQRLAIWALRTHQPRGNRTLLKEVIHTSSNREVVAEAFASLPGEPNPDDIKFLSEVVAGEGRTSDLPSLSNTRVNLSQTVNLGNGYYNPESDIPPELSDPFASESERIFAIRNARAGEAAVVRALGAPSVGSGVASASRPATVGDVLSTRSTYLYLREAAVRALGEYDVVDADARKTIGSPLFFGAQGVRRVFLPQDTLTIGQIGLLEDYYPLFDRMEVNLLWHPGFPEPAPIDRRKRPGRGSAAIAIGLLLERLGGGPQTVPNLVVTQDEKSTIVPRGGITPRFPANSRGAGPARSARSNVSANSITINKAETFIVSRTNPDLALLTHLQQSDEPSEFRAACAMALGIGGQKQRATEMKQVLESLTPGDAPVFGYSMLAMSLWGDADVLRYCNRQFGAGRRTIDAKALISREPSRRATPMPLNQVLARRAVAQALAVMGDPSSIPLLVSQWGQNPAVDSELARAIAWCHRDSTKSLAANSMAMEFGDDLADLLRQETAPALAVSAAASLGALYDNGSAERLNSILDGQTFFTRGKELGADGKMDLKKALQQQVLALGNPHYYLTAFGTEKR